MCNHRNNHIVEASDHNCLFECNDCGKRFWAIEEINWSKVKAVAILILIVIPAIIWLFKIGIYL